MNVGILQRWGNCRAWELEWEFELNTEIVLQNLWMNHVSIFASSTTWVFSSSVQSARVLKCTKLYFHDILSTVNPIMIKSILHTVLTPLKIRLVYLLGYPIFHYSLFCWAINIKDNLCIKLGNLSIFSA